MFLYFIFQYTFTIQITEGKFKGPKCSAPPNFESDLNLIYPIQAYCEERFADYIYISSDKRSSCDKQDAIVCVHTV